MRGKLKTAVALACACGLVMTSYAQGNNEQGATQDGQDTNTNVEKSTQKVTATILYKFTGNDAGKAGYAEGIITFTSSQKGVYNLYWSDDEGALEGYYAITQFELDQDDESQKVEFGYHTAIPADATKVIAIAEGVEEPTVEAAVAVYNILTEKMLDYKSTDACYTFNSYSDIHIDEEHWGDAPAYWWEYSEQHWADALDYAANMKVDFIVSSGDQVTNASFDNLNKEWKAYQHILAQSDYVNPIYEANGNHEIRQDGVVQKELKDFIIATGLDGDIQSIENNKPYYSFTEPQTGDLFIVMALEAGYRPAEYDQFTDEQFEWVEGLLEENYGKGKNIFLIQHALMSGYGPGDDLETPYYSGSMNPDLDSADRFKKILETYKDIIWISGHSHLDYALGYNYSNNHGTACNMIHNSSVSNPTHITDGAIDYTFDENLSQGYLVQVYENAILFNGANLCDQKIYPLYSYIIDGNTDVKETDEATKETVPAEDTEDLETTEETETEELVVTAGNVRSILANTNTVLGVYYEFSTYDQYQTLKEYYYQYKDADIDAMTEEECSVAYNELAAGISELYNIILDVNSILNDTPAVEEGLPIQQ